MVRGSCWRLLAPDADGDVQMDVVIGNKAVLEVAGKARVSGSVNTLRDRSVQQCLAIGGLDDIQRRPSTTSGCHAFYVRAECALMVFAGGGAHGEGDKGSGQGGPFAEAAGGRRPQIVQGPRAPGYSLEANKESKVTGIGTRPPVAPVGAEMLLAQKCCPPPQDAARLRPCHQLGEIVGFGALPCCWFSSVLVRH